MKEALLILVAALALPGTGTSQSVTSASAHADTARLSVILQEADVRSWHVRALLEDERLVEGEAEWRSQGVVHIAGQRFALSDIAFVERRVRRGGAGVKGFLIGSAVGAAAILTVASILQDSPGGPGGSAVLLSIGAGALVGGGPGAMIGSAMDPGEVEWVRLWP